MCNPVPKEAIYSRIFVISGRSPRGLPEVQRISERFGRWFVLAVPLVHLALRLELIPLAAHIEVEIHTPEFISVAPSGSCPIRRGFADVVAKVDSRPGREGSYCGAAAGRKGRSFGPCGYGGLRFIRRLGASFMPQPQHSSPARFTCYTNCG